ncbi:MAG TPA: amidohydrolase family protein [Vicinamibacteria bacterium]|jgi:cytosine/adenosine deaminase-related metal-dependent hydrolase|nr:amidohydrolase family protein [Vicinamibacteria bacterium]
MQILTASWVAPMVTPPLRQGRVAVEAGRVAWVGRPGDPGEPEGRLRDLGAGVILPGLVNAHCHLELSHLRGQIDGSAGFVPWVKALVDARAAEREEVVLLRAAEAIRELSQTGTVAVGDISNQLRHLDLLASSGLAAVVFYELLAWDPARAGSTLEGARARVAGLRTGPDVQVRLAAHAPYSTSAPLLEGLARGGGPAALHLAESAAESRFLAKGDGPWPAFLSARGLGHVAFTPPGLSPVRYVDGLGVLHPGLVAAHCVHVDDGDRALLARRGVHVAICPRSNQNLGVGLAPVPELWKAGVRLCLGTDSLASAPNLDLREDMATLRRQFPELPAAVIVGMATQGGADALGLKDLGTIAPGKRAALVHARAASDPEDPLEFLVSAGVRLERVQP